MSKSVTALKTSSTSKKTMGTKLREPSKDRNSTRKANGALTDTVNTAATGNIKTKPSVKLKESSSSNATKVKRVVTSDLNKIEPKAKVKPESVRSNLASTNKPSPTLNKTSKSVNKTSSTNQINTTKSKRAHAPETPPSSRVTKTQYFPSKKLYANAIQSHSETKSNNEIEKKVTTNTTEERSKTRTLDRSEIKVVKDKSKATVKDLKHSKSLAAVDSVPQKAFNNPERPKTATLKKGNIVNSNIAGPDIPKSETPSLASLDLSSYEQVSQQDDYEDDFDSYESDFEEYQSSSSSSLDDDLLEGEGITSDDTSSVATTPQQNILVDEERMMDSGNFDMPENKHKQLLDNIKESTEHENFAIKLIENNRSNMGSLSDEGFEEGKSSLQSQFINFAEAQKKWKQSKNLEKRRKRGEDILNMIRLDHYNFTLFDMAPVSYDVFIRSYGKTNTIQTSIQTGSDDISEEVQTEDIETTNKWTQFPVSLSKIDSKNVNYMEIYKQEYAGVGSDISTTENVVVKPESFNVKQLERFLTFASEIVLLLLDESFCSTTDRVEKNSRDIPFSSGYIKFNATSSTLLKARPISFVTYCSFTKILTVHGRSNTDEYFNDALSQKSIICIWSILNSEEPENILCVTGELNCCCFISEFKNMVTGGLCDGTITTWSLGGNRLHKEIAGNSNKPYYEEPNYTSGIGCGHSCKVVAIQQMSNTGEDVPQSDIEWKLPNNQICSLDENGTLIIWGIILRDSSSLDIPWNELSLVQNTKFSLKEFNSDLTDLLCTDMNLNVLDPHHMFISTNYGCVIQFLTTGTKAHPRKYNPAIVSQANCLEPCPFSSLYFFAGYENGTIVLYSRLLEKPLMSMSNKDDDAFQSGIQLIQWSYDKPFVFYAKDNHNTIHLWDLTISDLYPIYSVPFKENITCMKLSPSHMRNTDTSYMILATEDGSIHLHILKPDYGPSSIEQYQQDVKKFLNYVSRL